MAIFTRGGIMHLGNVVIDLLSTGSGRVRAGTAAELLLYSKLSGVTAPELGW